MVKGTQRRLAAIVSADVAGYSRLMGVDEEGTLAALKAHRHAMDPVVFSHGGHIVKTTGDGVLLDFPSAVQAVKSALAAQTIMAERNATLPQERQMQFRMGVHVGEIIDDDGDIFGDAVNIAARLQEGAELGGISLSGPARDAVVKNIDAPLIDLGKANFKNIAEPVRHWRVDMGGSRQTALNAAASQAPSDRSALAVLPFENMSGDAEQEYFSDGISEDIITALSRIHGLRVIARNSTFAYKGQAKDIRLIATELDARYVLEGSVRKGGNRVRINAQLIDATNGQHIWAERYDRELHDIFEVQDDITANIVNRTAPELLKAEGKRVRDRDSTHLDAWNLFLQARAAYSEASKNGFERAERLCRQAIESDPKYAPAYTLLSNSQYQLLVFGYLRGDSATWQAMLDNAEVASRLDPDELLWYAAILANMGQFAKALGFAERSLERNPGYAPAHSVLGGALYRDGQYEAAVAELETALRLSPNNPDNYQSATLLGFTHYSLRNYDAALSWADEAIRMAPTFAQAYSLRAASLAKLDRIDDAQVAAGQYLDAVPDTTATRVARSNRLRKQEDMDHFCEGLLKAGLPE